MAIPEINGTGIERLRNGKVLILGAGALGSLSAMYLAASGIGRIGIVEFDTVDISNLQRQLFYTMDGAGKPKLQEIASRISALNPSVTVDKYPFMANERNARDLLSDYDFIIDASDNASTKMMTDKVCGELEKSYCIGGVREGSGQVMSWTPGCIRYSDVFSTPECSGLTPCSTGGVLGPAAGVIASVQAGEAIKFITNTGMMLFNRMLIFDMLNLAVSIIRLC